MNIEIISVSKVKFPFVLEGEREYAKRFTRPWSVDVRDFGIDVKAISESEVKKREGQLVLDKISDGGISILLDERGKRFTSHGFADYLKKIKDGSPKKVRFLLGGAHGWDDEVRKKASGIIALSELTFPYQLCRLVMVEQLYRAYTIIENKPYHK